MRAPHSQAAEDVVNICGGKDIGGCLRQHNLVRPRRYACQHLRKSHPIEFNMKAKPYGAVC